MITEETINLAYVTLRDELFESKKGVHSSTLLQDDVFIQELNNLNSAKEVLEYVLDEDYLLDAFKDSHATVLGWLKQIATTDTAVLWQENPGNNCYFFQDLDDALSCNLQDAESAGKE